MSEESKKKLSDAQTWAALERMADEQRADDEVERVLGLSEAELDAELRAAGMDPEALGAEGEAIGRKLEAIATEGGKTAAPAEEKAAEKGGQEMPADDPSNVIPFERAQRKRRTWPIVVGTSTIAAAAAAGILQLLPLTNDVLPMVGSGLEGGAVEAALQARDLRDKALIACEEKRWDECRKGLDEAKRIFPEGENDVRVQRAREEMRGGE